MIFNCFFLDKNISNKKNTYKFGLSNFYTHAYNYYNITSHKVSGQHSNHGNKVFFGFSFILLDN
jgi:hypothetical protein